MVIEMQSSCDIGARLYNISTTTFTRAQKRWRRAYFSIYFSNTMLSSAKVSKKLTPFPISEIVATSEHTALKIITEAKNPGEHSERFSSIDQFELANVVKRKDLKTLHKLDGVKGLANSLHTSLELGINSHDIETRKTVFGSNTYKRAPPKGLISFVWEAFRNLTIISLLIGATVSLINGIRKHGAREGWYEGGSTFVAVFLSVAESAVSSFRQERQFGSLIEKSKNIKINAMREGRRQAIFISDVVVGDVVILNVGDQVPADGLFINGHLMLVDKSSMKGETDLIKVDADRHPFLFSGSKVADGYGHMLVISVGMNTAWGKMTSSITGNSHEKTPLQVRLHKLARKATAVGIAFAFFELLSILTRYFYEDTKDKKEMCDILTFFLVYFIGSVEGLPLIISLALHFSIKRMMAENVMVRKLSACETICSVTDICTHKTGTLTTNEMKVARFSVGLDDIEDDDPSGEMYPDVLKLYREGAGLYTTLVYKSVSGTKPTYTGSPTEHAIISWADTALGMDTDKLKQDYTILHFETFTSEKKRSGISVMKEEDGTVHVHWKGAPEIIIAMCSNCYQKNGPIKPIGQEEKKQLKGLIKGMAGSGLRCIAFAHMQFSAEEITNNTLKEEGLTLLGIVGIKNECRLRTKVAISTLRSAGVSIKMITGDHILTAKAIAKECGILEAGQQVNLGEVIEAAEFRNYTDDEKMKKVENIRVMARSSPSDKLLLIRWLKSKGRVVAMTGHASNDVSALKEADIGLSMGIQGTEVAKESSDMVILDDDFASGVMAFIWGRCMFFNIQKFIQFQLTAYISALVINFVKAVSTGGAPQKPILQFWANIVINTFSALAFAADHPTKDVMQKPPVGRAAPLITNVMLRNLLTQSSYQIVALLIIQLRGGSIFNINESVKDTIIFNTFVLCQVFNGFNTRMLEKKNIFEGLLENKIFLVMNGVTIILQVVIVEFLTKFTGMGKLNLQQWAICIAIAALSWPMGLAMRFIQVRDTPFLGYLEGWL